MDEKKVQVSIAEFLTAIVAVASGVALVFTIILNAQTAQAREEYTNKLEYLLEVETFQEGNAQSRLKSHEDSIMELKLNDRMQDGIIDAVKSDVTYIRQRVDQLVEEMKN